MFSSILEKLKLFGSFVFGIYLKFDACDLLFPVYPG